MYSALSVLKKNRSVPKKPLNDVPNIKPNPKIQKITTDTPKSAAFFNATLMLFLCLDKPVSIHMKPACIMKTKIAQSITYKVSILLLRTSITTSAVILSYDYL